MEAFPNTEEVVFLAAHTKMEFATKMYIERSGVGFFKFFEQRIQLNGQVSCLLNKARVTE